MIDLRKAGFDEEFAYKAVKNLTGDINSGQIKKMINLTKAGYNFKSAFEGAKSIK